MATGEFEEPFLTVAEVAEILRLNQQTVRNWIDAGSLPAIRVGRRVRIKRSDLDRILEDGYRGTPGTGPTGGNPNAEDFWGGEPVGAAEQATEPGSAIATAAAPAAVGAAAPAAVGAAAPAAVGAAAPAGVAAPAPVGSGADAGR